MDAINIDMETLTGWALALLVPTLLYVARSMNAAMSELRAAIQHLDGRLDETDRRVVRVEALTEERRNQRTEDKGENRDLFHSLQSAIDKLTERMDHWFQSK